MNFNVNRVKTIVTNPIGNVETEETQMIRNEEEYSKPKMLYKVKVVKGEI